MEIQACIVGLQEATRVFSDLSRFKKVLLFSDSQYVTENFVSAMNVWPKRAWRGANGTPVKNVDLWKRLRKEVNACPLRVEVRWVKGHKSNVYNRAADKLAKKSAGGCLNFCVQGARRLVHGGGRRLRRTHAAVGKSVLHLTRRSW
jgi:ribonuclease HI